jgi:DNA-binding transcriptional MerR regulator
VASAAAIVGVSSSQIRNWCAQFADYLSDQATPQPGQARMLTPTDVATLQRVQELRTEGVDYADIPEQLTGLDYSQLVPYVDVAPDVTAADQPAPPSSLATIELFGKLENRFQQMQGQIDQMRDEQAAHERDRMSAATMFGLGLIAGILLIGAIFLLFAVGFGWL